MNYNLIINTHWDREYRWSFPETQYRLAEAVDDLIDIMLKDEGFAYFHTDSQVSMLDDYLEMRPEKRPQVEALVKSGRILTGPWYTLPAQFLVNGESLVRNIQLGHRYARELGKVMKAGYNIFSWGQVSQLPQIYRQFGMDTIIFYRGIDQSSLESLEFRWKGADGTQALGITFGAYHRLNFWHYVYLPYILGNDRTTGWKPVGRDSLGEAFLTQMCGEELSDLNHWTYNQKPARDLKAAQKGLEDLIETVVHKSSTDELLFLQGFDQENPDPIVPGLVEELNGKLKDGQIRVASLEEYVKKVREKLTPQKLEGLAVKKGEMLAVEKVGDCYGPLYNGVFSARMPVKLANAQAEYLLTGSAEPIASWMVQEGEDYPGRLLDRAWKELLQNQQHDGIGGCHVDCVTTAMLDRYRRVKETAGTVVKNSLRRLTARIDCSYLKERQIGLVIVNPLPRCREEVVVCSVDVPGEWGLPEGREFGMLASDAEGNPVEVQILWEEENTLYAYLKYGNVFRFPATRCKIAVRAADIPAGGYVCLKVEPVENGDRYVENISSRDLEMENEHLKIKICWNGTLDVLDKKTGRRFKELHYFEDWGDKGGPLGFAPPYERGARTTLSRPADISLVYNGPLMAMYCVEHEWELPACMETELKIHVPHGREWIEQGRPRRTRDKACVRLRTFVTLKKGARSIEFETVIDNQAKDHRLRVMFPTDMTQAKRCRVDSPYDVVSREIAVPDSTGWYEAAARTWPSHSFVEVSEGKCSVSVLHKGIPEYEVTDNERRIIALTLLRCFSNAGNPTEFHEYQELAQCQGENTFRYSLQIGDGGICDGELAQKAMAYVTDLYVLQTTAHSGTLPAKTSFLETEGENFIPTAFCCEEERVLTVRGYQAGNEEEISIKIHAPVKKAWKTDLEGVKAEPLAVLKDGTVTGIHAGSREIVTVKLQLVN